MPRRRIVIRGDDSGSCHSANQAITDAYKYGILRNTSIMVLAPTFKEATQIYQELDGLCFGLHGTITDEWNKTRWGPIFRLKLIAHLRGMIRPTSQW